jgi:hypothetical protein
VELDK